MIELGLQDVPVFDEHNDEQHHFLAETRETVRQVIRANVFPRNTSGKT